MIIVIGTYRTGSYKFKSPCDTIFYYLAILQLCLVFPFFLCVCVIFLYLVFEFTYFYGKKKGIPPKRISTKMFFSEVRFNKRKQSGVLPTKHNLLKIAKINLQQQKLHKNYHLLAIPITVPLLCSPRLRSHHAFDSLISWLYFKNMVKEK